MQRPRIKAGKKHRGYAANIKESVGKAGSIVTDYQFDDNTKSDSEFFRKTLKKLAPRNRKLSLLQTAHTAVRRTQDLRQPIT